jgi:hypothetical protein
MLEVYLEVIAVTQMLRTMFTQRHVGEQQDWLEGLRRNLAIYALGSIFIMFVLHYSLENAS